MLNRSSEMNSVTDLGLPNDIYSLIDSNKTAKDLWDALARHMLGFKYGEQDRKAAVLYECETFKATEGELLLDTYIRYLQVINDLKKCGYSKDNSVKRIFRYLKGTINLGLWYPKDSGFDLTAYSDADHVGCHLDRKSTSGSIQILGDKLVCWSFKKHNCLSISTAESEYVAVSSYCAQVLWMRTQLTDYGFFYDKVPIYCDSKSTIAISCNLVQHTRTKHLDVRYHFIKDHVEKGTIELYFVGTEYQLADLFTKSLPEARFKFLVEKLGMMSRET
nr:retrovirus-related Pol polyprotein from transposon TNT 1-94 [Tanacetum cinerariifolium]